MVGGGELVASTVEYFTGVVIAAFGFLKIWVGRTTT